MSEQFENLILKSLQGTLTKEEHEALERWINLSPENSQQMESFKTIWKATNDKASIPDFETASEWERLKKTIDVSRGPLQKQKSLWAPVFKVAATVALLIVGSFIIHLTLREPQFTTIESTSEIRSAMLPDGTTVVLNKGAKIVFPDNFNAEDRVVMFSGEAFFDVARNPAKPFVINTGDADVEVVGTSFNVRSVEGEPATSVYVVTGKVKVSGPGAGSDVLVIPGEMASYDRSSGLLQKTSQNETSNALAWRDRKLTFRATQLSKVIEAMEHYFNIHITPEDPGLLNCRFTSTFDDPTLEEVLEALSVSLDLKFSKQNNDTYVLSGKGCR